jgi:YD repeat-containing protein
MKRLIIILSSSILLFTFYSCTKNPGPSGNGNSGLLKSMMSIVAVSGHNDTTTTTFTYDNQSRVVTQVAVITPVNATNQTTYAYYTDSIVQDEVTAGFSVTYFLNNWGFRGSDNLGDNWVYNSNGYLTSKATAGGSTTSYTYNGLNQLATQTNVAAGTTTTDTYTYASNPIGTAGTSWQMGKSTGAQPQTDVQVKNSVTTTFTYTYLTDSQGRLSQETVTSSATGSSPVVTYFAYY